MFISRQKLSQVAEWALERSMLWVAKYFYRSQMVSRQVAPGVGTCGAPTHVATCKSVWRLFKQFSDPLKGPIWSICDIARNIKKTKNIYEIVIFWTLRAGNRFPGVKK